MKKKYITMKIWSVDNPKAGMMLEKRNAIIEAAGKVFLDSGYAESSMNRVAEDAGVSIKTVYRHFENKDDLFVAVIKVACIAFSDDDQNVEAEPAWFKHAPEKALKTAGESYLRHIIDKDHVALFRVINRDSHKFPELGKKYYQEVVSPRNMRMVKYLELWKNECKWEITDTELAANSFAALLRGQLFENILLGFAGPTEKEIIAHVDINVALMLHLLKNNQF